MNSPINPAIADPPAPFLPAGRAHLDSIRAVAAAIPANSTGRQLLEGMPGLACVLNRQRQIIGMNRRFLDLLEVDSAEQVLGMRVGEALHCVRSGGAPDGCGTTPGCATCGAAQAMRAMMVTGEGQIRDCRITVERGEGRASLDFEAVVSPLKLGGAVYMICALRDIAAEKRRDVLERVFFHDVLNTAGGLAGLTELMLDLPPEEQPPGAQATMARLANLLVEEIQAQRALTFAERGELVPSLSPVDVPALLADLVALYRAHEVAAGRNIELLPGAPQFWTTDPILLRRIIGNLVKNALEATPPGGTVTVGADADGEAMLCTVHNPGRMPEAVQAQVFQRSFSTKGGTGRGIGTYSVQLFAERVLSGSVSFTSDHEGTTFAVRLPAARPD